VLTVWVQCLLAGAAHGNNYSMYIVNWHLNLKQSMPYSLAFTSTQVHKHMTNT